VASHGASDDGFTPYGSGMTFGRTNGPVKPGTLSLRGRALRLLSQREHSRAELTAKLRPHCGASDELEALLADLETKGWLDDKRASDSLVHRKATRFGAARIKQDLHAKGLSPDLIASALDGLRASEVARAQVVWQKKFGRAAQTPAERAKQMRFLLTRGFNASVANRVVGGRAVEDVENERVDWSATSFCSGGDDPVVMPHHSGDE
jgi:regulatory protein